MKLTLWYQLIYIENIIYDWMYWFFGYCYLGYQSQLIKKLKDVRHLYLHNQLYWLGLHLLSFLPKPTTLIQWHTSSYSLRLHESLYPCFRCYCCFRQQVGLVIDVFFAVRIQLYRFIMQTDGKVWRGDSSSAEANRVICKLLCVLSWATRNLIFY